MLEPIALSIALVALAVTAFTLRRAQGQVDALKGDLEVVENHNRTLQEQRETLKHALADTTSGLASVKTRLETTELEKQEIEQRRAALEEAARGLEKRRADLEDRLTKLRSDHEALELRVVDFQGLWSHQLSTLEAEISTLVRQLGEFRKGTQLPLPNGPEPAEREPGHDPSWTLSAPVSAPATGRPRAPTPLSSETGPRRVE